MAEGVIDKGKQLSCGKGGHTDRKPVNGCTDS